jgi:hypothetical protein
MNFGDYDERAKSLIELLKQANDRYLKALNERAHEPDSDIAYDIEHGVGTAKGTHASMGRDPSTRAEFEKVRFGREWPREEWFHHKGFPKWHPAEIETMGVQKPPITRKYEFYPGVKESQS